MAFTVKLPRSRADAMKASVSVVTWSYWLLISLAPVPDVKTNKSSTAISFSDIV